MTANEQPEWLKAYHEANPSGGQRGWLPGESGNPAGRRKGSKNRKTLLVEEFEKDGSAIARVVISKALEGDMTAANIALARLSPPLRPRAEKVQFELTPDASLTTQASQILVGISQGNIDPETGQLLINCISSFAGLKQVDDLENRLAILEGRKMNRFVPLDSEEYKAMQRDRRIHVMPTVKGARAVDVVFETHRYVVHEKTLSNSIAVARKLVHDLMRHSDNDPSRRGYACATISPISAERARALCEHGKYAFDPDQAREDYKLIAVACYDIIGNCDDAKVRLQAAHILQSIGSRAEDAH